MSRLAENARRGNLVVLAGAGLSVIRPSALPGWWKLNEAVLQALRTRLESALHRGPTKLGQWIAHVDGERTANRFPPEYQAQLIEEMCGERYFMGLQSLDVEVVNRGHEGIAALAGAGALKAVVTTNFDRLTERALDNQGVEYEVAYDDAGFARMGDRLRQGRGGPLPVIKIHGCVSDHRSMIDTLKQRKRGRSRLLQECLETLFPSYWLYLGFSADDLLGNPDYLGLTAGAKRSAGATYIVFPGEPRRPKEPELGKGAKVLMDAYGDRGERATGYIPDQLADLCNAIGAPAPVASASDESLGLQRFHEKLQQWADTLTPAAAGLCLAAVLEAAGQAEPAVRLLDLLVRKEQLDERDSPDFLALQLHYLRLGAAWGRFIGVRDVNGAVANATQATINSLWPLQHSTLEFAAKSCETTLYLWLNDGATAMKLAQSTLRGLLTGFWGGLSPRNDEEAVDAWISAAQVLVLNEGAGMPELVAGTAGPALERAKVAGDVVRAARVAALHLLSLGRTGNNLPVEAERYNAEFDEAARVGDGFALGMRSLALGRWHVGIGGLTLAATAGTAVVAQRALAHLQAATSCFENQGMHPWILYSMVQQAKAHGDLRDFDKVWACMGRAENDLERFRVLKAHCYEASWQLFQMIGDPKAAQGLRMAQQAAGQSGLKEMHDRLISDGQGA